MAPFTGQASKARLILQDPLAFDQASQPALRASYELIPEISPTMEREKARELWESLSLDPEVAQERLSERKRLLIRADTLARETAVAQEKVLALQAQLEQEKSNRLNHPLVYASAAGLLGLGAMWLIERRRRLRLEQRADRSAESEPIASGDEPVLLDQDDGISVAHDSVYALEDAPNLAIDFPADMPMRSRAKPESRQDLRAADGVDDPLQLQDAIQTDISPVASAQDTPVWAKPKQSSGLLSEDDLLAMLQSHQREPFLSRFIRRFRGLFQNHKKSAPTTSPYAPVEGASTRVQSQNVSTQPHPDQAQSISDRTKRQEELDGVVSMTHLSGPESARNSDLDTQALTNLAPRLGGSIMEHLLELRTAVNGLCALGRPQAAAQILREHLDASPDTCTWAYVEYMHLCESIDRRDDFETIRKRYRTQFNRMAPYWQEPNSYLLGLDSYARATSELCTIWAQGKDSARLTIAAWLVGPLLGRKIVQLPAYHDLFDLYEMLDFIDVPAEAVVSSSGLIMQARREQIARPGSSGYDSQREVDDFLDGPELDFLPTVSLLDLDYEFSSDVTLERHDAEQSEKAVTIVKPGHFSVDFNVDGTEIGGLFSQPAELVKK